jgi:anti-sigma B factor antagonist
MDDYGLTVGVRQEPGHVLVTVGGEVDIATVPQLRERLAAPAASGRPLIVHLDGVTFIDAAGLGVLASGRLGLRYLGVQPEQRLMRAWH